MELNENILDVPFPWVSRLDISKELFRLKYPPRGRTTEPTTPGAEEKDESCIVTCDACTI